nr:immunoglobulin light chain junction region [Macaca mulatta]
CQQYYSTPYSC